VTSGPGVVEAQSDGAPRRCATPCGERGDLVVRDRAIAVFREIPQLRFEALARFIVEMKNRQRAVRHGAAKYESRETAAD